MMYQKPCCVGILWMFQLPSEQYCFKIIIEVFGQIGQMEDPTSLKSEIQAYGGQTKSVMSHSAGYENTGTADETAPRWTWLAINL